MKNILHYCLIGIISLLLFNCGGGSNILGGSKPGNNDKPAPNLPAITVSLDDSDGAIANGALDTSLTPIFTLKFSEAIDPATLDVTKIILSKNYEQTKYELSLHNLQLDATQTRVTFSPSEPLQSLTTYYLSVSSEVKTSDGRSLQANQFSFTTGDYSKPMVAITPENDDVRVATSPSIIAMFSKTVTNVNTSTVTLRESFDNGPPIAIEISKASNNSYLITTANPLQQYTDYYISFSSDIVDLLGNHLTRITLKFTTGDEDGPSAALLNMLNGATNITSKETSIRFKFSEEVMNVNTATVFLRESSPNGPQVPVKLTNLGQEQFEVSPESGYLKRETTYHLVFSPLITDLNDNPVTTSGFVFSTRKGYLYYFNRNDTKNNSKAELFICNIAKDSNNIDLELDNKCIKDNQYGGGRRLIMNKKGTVAYISRGAENSISECDVDEANGKLINCTNPTLGKTLKTPIGLALSKSERHLFIVNAEKDSNSGQITTCTLGDNGKLIANSCVIYNLPNDVSKEKLYTINLNNAGDRFYVTEHKVGAYVHTCAFDGESLASASDCTKVYADNKLDRPYEVVFNRQGTISYQAVLNSNLIKICNTVNNNGTLSNCPANTQTLTKVTALALSADETVLYYTTNYEATATTTSNQLGMCTLFPSTGAINSCIKIVGGNYTGHVYIRY